MFPEIVLELEFVAMEQTKLTGPACLHGEGHLGLLTLLLSAAC